MLDEIEEIKMKYNKSFQVIVLEHADRLILKKNRKFSDYVMRRWSRKGDKLI